MTGNIINVVDFRYVDSTVLNAIMNEDLTLYNQ